MRIRAVITGIVLSIALISVALSTVTLLLGLLRLGNSRQTAEFAIRPSQNLITVVGTLTNEGVECQALRGDDGTVYTLSGDLNRFKNGDHVRVVGEVAQVSTCQQGTTINVRFIKRAR